MLYRCFRKIDTAQWIDVLFTVEGDAFSVSEASHRADMALGLGLLPAESETIDSGTDPRTGNLLATPTVPQDASQDRLDRIAAILVIARSQWSTAELREIVQLTAQETVK